MESNSTTGILTNSKFASKFKVSEFGGPTGPGGTQLLVARPARKFWWFRLKPEIQFEQKITTIHSEVIFWFKIALLVYTRFY